MQANMLEVAENSCLVQGLRSIHLVSLKRLLQFMVSTLLPVLYGCRVEGSLALRWMQGPSDNIQHMFLVTTPCDGVLDTA